jgi:CRP-like cAMP-binding protein
MITFIHSRKQIVNSTFRMSADVIKAIKSTISNILPVSSEATAKLVSFVTVKTISAGEDFVRRGTRNESEYFIVKGICRGYVLNPDGQDITLSFYRENTAMSPHICRTVNFISQINVQALTDTVIGSFNTMALMNLMIEDPEIRNWGNKVLETELLLKSEKEYGMAAMTAKERLLHFRNKYSNLENLIPHPYIASYLGITSVSLSRLRRDLAEKK